MINKIINYIFYFAIILLIATLQHATLQHGGVRQANMATYQANTHTGQLVTYKRQAKPRAYQADNRTLNLNFRGLFGCFVENA